MDSNDIQIENTIQERIDKLPLEIIEIFTLGTFSNVTEKISNQYNLSTTQERVLVEQISLVLLFFMPKAGFSERIYEHMEISGDLSVEIKNYVETEIFSLVDDILTEYDEYILQNIEIPDSKPVSITSTDEYTPSTVTSQTAPEPAVQPLHTMEHDMDKIHGYGAYRKMYPDTANETTQQNNESSELPEEDGVIAALSQEDTLREPPTLTPTPTYTNEDTK